MGRFEYLRITKDGKNGTITKSHNLFRWVWENVHAARAEVNHTDKELILLRFEKITETVYSSPIEIKIRKIEEVLKMTKRRLIKNNTTSDSSSASESGSTSDDYSSNDSDFE